MKSILFITNSLSFGGAEKMVIFVADSLASRGYKISIVNLKSTDTDKVTDYRRTLSDKVSVFELPEIPTNKERNLFTVKFIKNIAKKQKAELLVGFVGYPNMYAVIVGKILHIPSIISERGDPSRKNTEKRTLLQKFLSKVRWIIVNHATGGVFQTPEAQSYYCKHLQKHGVVINNPVYVFDDITIMPQYKRTKTIVSVGRFYNEQKRYDIMLKAFKIFLESHPEYILKLYGKGPDEKCIRQWCLELKLANHVKFCGLTTNPMRDIVSDGMFLITSDYEGISNSLLEAMAVGLPCVATDHSPGGARLLIQDHENGLLAPVGNCEKLAAAMSEFAYNPDLAKKCGENAQEVINRFHPNRITDMWEQYINLLLNK